MNNTTQRWVPQPNGRGTVDTIWSCAFTIFLCCWSSLCVNVAARGESRWNRLCSKFHLACLGMLGPELLVTLALGQYNSARLSVHRFRSTGYSEQTMSHAFFANMGDFVLQTPGYRAFPLNAKQLHYLVKMQLVALPLLEKEDIEDRDKYDSLSRYSIKDPTYERRTQLTGVRFLMVCQVLWFSLSSIGRAASHPNISTMEFTTLAFIPCMLATSVCWRHKPADVGRPIILHCESPISEILIAAGDEAKEPYRNTPLDFVSREEWLLSLLWLYDQNILRCMRLLLFGKRLEDRPITRMPNEMGQP